MEGLANQGGEGRYGAAVTAHLANSRKAQLKEAILSHMPPEDCLDEASLQIRQNIIERMETARFKERELTLADAYAKRLTKVAHNLENRNHERDFAVELRLSELREDLLEQEAEELRAIEDRRHKTLRSLTRRRRASEEHVDALTSTGKFARQPVMATTSHTRRPSRGKRDVISEYANYANAEPGHKSVGSSSKPGARRTMNVDGTVLSQHGQLQLSGTLSASSSVTGGKLPSLAGATFTQQGSIKSPPLSSISGGASKARFSVGMGGLEVVGFGGATAGSAAAAATAGSSSATLSDGSLPTAAGPLSAEAFLSLVSAGAAATAKSGPPLATGPLEPRAAQPPSPRPPASRVERVAGAAVADLERAAGAIAAAKAGIPACATLREPVPEWRTLMPVVARPPTPELTAGDPRVEEAAEAERDEVEVVEEHGEGVQGRVLADMAKRADLVAEMRYDMLTDDQRAAAEAATVRRLADEAAAAADEAARDAVVGAATAATLQHLADELIRQKQRAEEGARQAAEAAAAQAAAEASERARADAERQAAADAAHAAAVAHVNRLLAESYVAQTLEAAAQRAALQQALASSGLSLSYGDARSLFDRIDAEAHVLGLTSESLLDSIVQPRDNLLRAAEDAAETAAHYRRAADKMLDEALQAAMSATAAVMGQAKRG